MKKEILKQFLNKLSNYYINNKEIVEELIVMPEEAMENIIKVNDNVFQYAIDLYLRYKTFDNETVDALNLCSESNYLIKLLNDDLNKEDNEHQASSKISLEDLKTITKAKNVLKAEMNAEILFNCYCFKNLIDYINDTKSEFLLLYGKDYLFYKEARYQAEKIFLDKLQLFEKCRNHWNAAWLYRFLTNEKVWVKIYNIQSIIGERFLLQEVLECDNEQRVEVIYDFLSKDIKDIDIVLNKLSLDIIHLDDDKINAFYKVLNYNSSTDRSFYINALHIIENTKLKENLRAVVSALGNEKLNKYNFNFLIARIIAKSDKAVIEGIVEYEFFEMFNINYIKEFLECLPKVLFANSINSAKYDLIIFEKKYGKEGYEVVEEVCDTDRFTEKDNYQVDVIESFYLDVDSIESDEIDPLTLVRK